MHKTNISRRKFIKTLASSSLLVPSLYSPYVFSLAKRKKLGVALVGLGYYSTDILAPALQMTRHCYLAGIVTGSPEKIPVWQKRYAIPDKNVYSYDTMHELANNPAIDVVYVVVPTSLHEKYSVIAANAGKHVWCEKPMAMTAKECQSIIDVCGKNKVKLSIGYRLQHEPNTQAIMAYARSQPFGAISKVKAEAGYWSQPPAPGNWRLKRAMGGGALYDMGVYPLNAARYATGKEPISILARHETIRTDAFKEVDESSYFTLQFPGGAIAECATSVGKRMNSLHVTCEKGWYKLEPFQSYNGVKGVTSTGIELNKTIDNQQARQMDNDALSIMNQTPVLVPGEEGLKDIVVVEAALKSAASGDLVELQ